VVVGAAATGMLSAAASWRREELVSIATRRDNELSVIVFSKTTLQKVLSLTLVAVVQTQQPCEEEEEEEAAAVQHHSKAFSDHAGLSPPPTHLLQHRLSLGKICLKKKKTHTQLGCCVNGQMMIDEVATSVVPSSNFNFALNLIPQALLSGRLNPPPCSCCCCCCNLSFFFCQIP
jgi:hypothetical protein